MKAILKAGLDPGVELVDVPVPRPGPGEVLVEVKVCGICGSDWATYDWTPEGLERLKRGTIVVPRIMGHEPAGVVVELGEGVQGLAEGDRVALDTVSGCGTCDLCRRGHFNICDALPRIGVTRDGALAEYVVQYAHSVYRIPDNVSFEAGALLQPLGVSLHAVEISGLKPGDTVAVVGPGPVGLMVAMVARASGASRILVLGRRRNKFRLDMARQLGFTAVVRAGSKVVDQVMEATNGCGVDVLFECAGYPSGVFDLVRRGGEVILAGGPKEGLSLADMRALQARPLLVRLQQSRHPSTWERAINLVASGALDVTPLVTHRVPLESGPDAFPLLRDKRAMTVLITMA